MALLFVKNHFERVRVGRGDFERLAHTDSAKRAGFHAEPALGAARKVVNIATEHLFAGDVLGRKHVDRGVRASAFAHAASGAVVVSVGVLDHFESATVAFVHLERLPIFRILLGYDASGVKEILERNGETANQAPRARNAAFQVTLDVSAC